jgi:hypothetical protein
LTLFDQAKSAWEPSCRIADTIKTVAQWSEAARDKLIPGI